MPPKRAPLLAIDPAHPEPRRIQQAVEKLRAGWVVLYPTDTLYGLAGDPEARESIDRIYQLRGLDRKKPLSLVSESLSEASRYAIIDDDCYRVMRKVLPGPYTFILRATKDVPRTGDQKRRLVGIRIPRHPVATALVRALGHPLISASAIDDGESGGKPPRRSASRVDLGPATGASDPVHLAERYGSDLVGLVLDAGILEGTPSSVIDWSEDAPVLLRRGAGDVSFLEA
jgi:tRNA threonylcarbamoyl adenosine modification protein (Sua5/YciO/YrdC/YwlC family)